MIRAASGWAAALAVLLTASAAAASEAPPSPEARPLEDVELSAMRGGLRTPDGLEFGFGAVVRTFVDGNLALESQLTWTDRGAVETVSGGGPSAGLEGLSLPGGGAVDWQGVVLPGDGGATTVLHNLTGDSIQNVILNTANNRDIRQETAVTLNLPTLDQLQKDAIAARLTMRLDEAVGSALGEAALH